LRLLRHSSELYTERDTGSDQKYWLNEPPPNVDNRVSL
jgi:hypothetical protein